MTDAVFGDSLDIHAGGIDLKFPHHNNEQVIGCLDVLIGCLEGIEVPHQNNEQVRRRMRREEEEKEAGGGRRGDGER